MTIINLDQYKLIASTGSWVFKFSRNEAINLGLGRFAIRKQLYDNNNNNNSNSSTVR